MFKRKKSYKYDPSIIESKSSHLNTYARCINCAHVFQEDFERFKYNLKMI